MKKIALAMIVKGDDVEAKLLDRCLKNMSPHVDGIFITRTQPNKEVARVTSKYGGHLSDFEWCNDFSKARNFNFSQVPKDYDYILWSDADDQWRGLEKLRGEIEKHKGVESFGFWYLYDFDEYKNPTVVHKKTMLVKNDGCVEWRGVLHEDLTETRAISSVFIEGVERIHMTTQERVLSAKSRNVVVAQHDLELNPNDPRALWNLANSYLGANNLLAARDTFAQFIEKTGSDEEKYLAMSRIGEVEKCLGNDKEAVEWLWKAIGLRPTYPDAIHALGYLHFDKGRLDEAERYLLTGLVLKPPYHTIIVYNPRDYDYNPMMALAKIYIRKSRPDMALPMLRGCLQIAPKNEYLQAVVSEAEKELEFLSGAVKFVQEHENDTDDELTKALNTLDSKLSSHPAICLLRNRRFIKKETTGKDISYYCGMTDFDWNPDLFKTKGFGGSEEAVINLSKEWATQGYNVTVYNSCGTEPMVRDGVTYKPWWFFNPRDAVDTLIVWRHPKILDYELNAKKILVDLHDVVKEGEFPESRLKKINRIMVKTKFHRSLFPKIPDEKFLIVPNGMDLSLAQPQEKDHNLIVNTSSPDRSLDVLPELFQRVKKRVPTAKLTWVYGWHNFDDYYKNDKEKMEWKDATIQKMNEVGINAIGRVTQKEAMELCAKAQVFAYPSEFAEIDCISVKKAQAVGAIPVTTDFGALNESVAFGHKVHSKKNKDNWSMPYQFTFGLTDREGQDQWVDACVSALQEKADIKAMTKWAKRFSWDVVAREWGIIEQ
jgi:glycosyltransferase involved in cell wall biosynthesis